MLRKDGESTRRRILEAALEIFGERGYRDATIADVCEAAHANIAAVNYHFGSKKALYRAVCEHAIDAMATRYPPTGQVALDAPPEARLRGLIEAVLGRGRVAGPLRHYHSLRMRETFHTTGLADDIWNDWFEIHRRLSSEILTELLGAGALPEDVLRCQMSLMSQCYIANSSAVSARYHNVDASHLSDTGAVADHIYRFTLAGVRATAEVRQQGSVKACT